MEESQILMVRSSEDEASSRASSENVTDLTKLLCPISIWRQISVAESQIMMVQSSLGEATSRTSAEKATEMTELI